MRIVFLDPTFLDYSPYERPLGGSQSAICYLAVELARLGHSVAVVNGTGVPAYAMDHTTIVYPMDKERRFVAPFSLKRRPEEAAADLRRYL